MVGELILLLLKLTLWLNYETTNYAEQVSLNPSGSGIDSLIIDLKSDMQFAYDVLILLMLELTLWSFAESSIGIDLKRS